MEPCAGYVMGFEPADGNDTEGEWEEWPDRYVFDIVVPENRIASVCRSLFTLLPGRVYPILDILGHDAFREIDPYISYCLVGLDHLTDAVQRYSAFFFEDGMCGFGAMCDDPFIYIFVDEHKIITVRVQEQDKERVERVLQAYDLSLVDEPMGADAVMHEHRSVLRTPGDQPRLLGVDQVIEKLRTNWHLTLNIDIETNLDDDANELGVTGWRCFARLFNDDPNQHQLVEILLTADSLHHLEDLVFEVTDQIPAPDDKSWDEIVILSADRLETADFLRECKTDSNPEKVAMKTGKVIKYKLL